MANFSATKTTNIRLNRVDNPDIYSVNIEVAHNEWTSQALSPTPNTSTDKTDNQPITNPTNNYNVYKSANYHDDFFERVHITPLSTDMGFVISPVTFKVYVYNAYLQDTQQFTAINSVNNSDAPISGQSAPYTMQPTQELEYTVTAPSEGNSTIYTTHTWDFATANDVETLITGIRLALFSHRPQMPYNERLGWSTDVMTSKNGTEQRIARATVARQIIEHDYLVSDRIEEQTMRSLITGQMNRQFGVPIWEQQKTYSSNLSSGITTINFDTNYMDLRNDSLMVIWKSYDEYEVVTIDTVAPASVTLSRALINDFIAPVLLMPVRICYVEGDISGRLYSNQVALRSIDFKVSDNTEITGYSADETYLTIPVLTDCQLFQSDAQDEIFSTDNRTIDYNQNNFVQYNDWLINRTTFEYGLEKIGLENKWKFRQLLHYLKGQFKPVFIPSGRHDITLANNALSTDVNLEIENIGYTQFLNHDNYRAYICIVKNDALNYYTVQSAQVLGNGNEQIALDRAIGFDLSIGEGKIQYMPLFRLASDRVEIEHLTANELNCSLRFIEINDEA